MTVIQKRNFVDTPKAKRRKGLTVLGELIVVAITIAAALAIVVALIYSSTR